MKQKKYLFAIGLTVIGALFLLVRSLLFLHPTPGDGKTVLHVHFQNVDKIASGTRVTFAGKPVGEVKQVNLLSEQAFSGRTHRVVFPYEVILAIDSSVKVYKSDIISVKTAGLMGERFIAITPCPAPEGKELVPVTSDMVLTASASGNAEEAIEEIQEVVRKADITMQALIDLINKNQESVYQTTLAVKNASNQLELLLTTLNNEGFSERLATLTTKSVALVDKIDAVVSSLERGEGTLGKLYKDSSLYDSFQHCVCRTNQFVTDMNEYGLFFNTNRDWQRDMLIRKEEIAQKTSVDATRMKFENVKKAISELNTTLCDAKETMDRDSLTNKGALREEFTQSYAQLQNELKELHRVMSQIEVKQEKGKP